MTAFPMFSLAAQFTALPPLLIGGIVSAFTEQDISGKVICDTLFIGSILAWTIMVTKMRELRRAKLESLRFLSAYRKESHPVSLFLKRHKYQDSPLYMIYDRTCSALGATLESRGANPAELFMGGVSANPQHLSPTQLNWVRNVAERTMADRALALEDRLGYLAIAVSAAPFLGLLGTVWGVMICFGSIKGSAPLLSEVAPGISAALLTTIIGLLVALPSSIGYNLLATQIREMRVRMDNYLQEFMSDLERHFLHE